MFARLTAAAIAAVVGAALGAAAPVPLPKSHPVEPTAARPVPAPACVCPAGRSAPTIASISGLLSLNQSATPTPSNRT